MLSPRPLNQYLRQRTQCCSYEYFHNLLKQHSYLHRTSPVSPAAPLLLDMMCVCVCAFYQIWLHPAVYLIYIFTNLHKTGRPALCITPKKTNLFQFNNFIVINKLTFNGRMRLSLEMRPSKSQSHTDTVGFRKSLLIRQMLWLKMRRKKGTAVPSLTAGNLCNQPLIRTIS